MRDIKERQRSGELRCCRFKLPYRGRGPLDTDCMGTLRVWQ